VKGIDNSNHFLPKDPQMAPTGDTRK